MLQGERRCARQGVPLCCTERRDAHFGKRSPPDVRVRKLANLLGCHPQLAPDGSENVGVCLHHIFHRRQQHRRDGTLRLLNESIWRWPARGVTAFERLPGNLDVHPRRFRVNCGAMLRRAVAASSIGPRPRSGTPIARQEDRSLRNSRRTLRCKSMSGTGLPATLRRREEERLRDLRCRGRVVVMAADSLGDGLVHGVRNRSRADC